MYRIRVIITEDENGPEENTFVDQQRTGQGENGAMVAFMKVIYSSIWSLVRYLEAVRKDNHCEDK